MENSIGVSLIIPTVDPPSPRPERKGYSPSIIISAAANLIVIISTLTFKWRGREPRSTSNKNTMISKRRLIVVKREIKEKRRSGIGRRFRNVLLLLLLLALPQLWFLFKSPNHSFSSIADSDLAWLIASSSSSYRNSSAAKSMHFVGDEGEKEPKGKEETTITDKVTEGPITQKDIHASLNQYPYPKLANFLDLPKVQAWPDVGDIQPAKSLPSINLRLISTVQELILVQQTPERLVANFTKSEPYNADQPSMKQIDHPLTLLNVEVPTDYSIEASMMTTIPWSNETTLAFYQGKFYSGFRNQIMAFMILVFESQREGHGQILLRSVSLKDTYGTNSHIPFAKLWDVAHWNSHYPRLPRLVDYDPILHSQFNYDNSRWFRTPQFGDDTNPLPTKIKEPPSNWFGTYGLFASSSPMRPYSFGKQPMLMTAYMRYAQGKGIYAGDKDTTGHLRNPTEILVLKGAMRPHPDLQTILDGLLQNASLLEVGKSTANLVSDSSSLHLDYMTLHARVEPDMQKHVMCRDKKVLNLTSIFYFIEKKWKDPPVSRIFIPINREYLELEGSIDGLLRGNVSMILASREKLQKESGKKEINWIAVENLQALNRARDEGLWEGRVKVFEFGANSLKGTSYASKPSTAGAMLNFFIGVPAKIFIGTEVSSFSHDILATRFFRGYQENYKYLPEGLVDWTPPGTSDPPGFVC